MIKLRELIFELYDISDINDDIVNYSYSIGIDIEGIISLINGRSNGLSYLLLNTNIFPSGYKWLFNSNIIELEAKRGLLIDNESWAHFHSLGNGEGIIYIDKDHLENCLISKKSILKLKFLILHELYHAIQAKNGQFNDIDDRDKVSIDMEKQCNDFAKKYL
jgi:hypothetical protein